MPVIKRRDILRFVTGVSIGALFGCRNKSSNSAEEPIESAQSPANLPNCIVRPQQTEGPYFVDERLNRSDIRSDPSIREEKEGVLLKLTFQVNQVSPDACLPIEGVIVDIWHCDAQGIYSDATDPNFNTVGQKFLRGYQVTDASGIAEFITIYPGWYPGRTVHIHFKLRDSEDSQQRYEFTSQLYFEGAVSNQVFNQAPYNIREQRTIRNELDGIYRDGGDQLTIKLTQDQGNGTYTGIFNIGLEIS
ncbi:intradiol ring-cleavage dioxygenase (plasmid) [Acaryochloris sp. 'Moss Beach']|uniref:intradiol ring-cleavage dioxygenase n=1 Tax=Acaryochloris sp. 'Moss Beach' TaxID=2740837 RepID=UPI001F1FB922|nr:intradiol ring-cleavage dioxygenase [Acaryochloris sp. 'Moss Beach']UJB72956.1 intradiol ring-cleavage dioxygenase [Acaryochloris sp. 'Moss Beach']